MLLDAVKPVALVLCLLSLCAVFSTAFLQPASGLEQRILDSSILLCLAAGICVARGMLFREGTSKGVQPLMRTLPVQVFFWAASVILVLFVASLWLETYCIFYRDVRRF